jgi:hypothetical protein
MLLRTGSAIERDISLRNLQTHYPTKIVHIKAVVTLCHVLYPESNHAWRVVGSPPSRMRIFRVQHKTDAGPSSEQDLDRYDWLGWIQCSGSKSTIVLPPSLDHCVPRALIYLILLCHKTERTHLATIMLPLSE